MKSIRLLAMACAFAGVSSVFAGTITFEGAPTGVDLGAYYSGVTFGAEDRAVQQVLPFFPAHSGSEELINYDILNPVISFNFANPQTSFSFWYISANGFSGVATLADGSTMAFTGSNAGYNKNAVLGNPGTYSVNTFLGETNTTGNSLKNIVSVSITDNSGLGNFTDIDDLSAPGISGAPAPDAASTLALLGIAGLGLLAFRRKVAAQ